jgi:hypothetical protein
MRLFLYLGLFAGLAFSLPGDGFMPVKRVRFISFNPWYQKLTFL